MEMSAIDLSKNVRNCKVAVQYHEIKKLNCVLHVYVIHPQLLTSSF
jgi:hypothetical protein